jgi:hypothetical protein
VTVRVTLRGGTVDKFMRYGDAYVKHHDGTLDVVRVGAKERHRYSSGEWTDVQGDEKKSKKAFFG